MTGRPTQAGELPVSVSHFPSSANLGQPSSRGSNPTCPWAPAHAEVSPSVSRGTHATSVPAGLQLRALLQILPRNPGRHKGHHRACGYRSRCQSERCQSVPDAKRGPEALTAALVQVTHSSRGGLRLNFAKNKHAAREEVSFGQA